MNSRPETPHSKAEAKLAKAENAMTWSLRSLKTGPALLVAASVMAVLDFGGGDKTILSAVTLFVCFVAVFCGLVGLFGLAFAHETPGVRPTPSWAVPCGIASIVGSFAVGLFGVLT